MREECQSTEKGESVLGMGDAKALGRELQLGEEHLPAHPHHAALNIRTSSQGEAG
jgi:hypothetical protein